MDEPFDLPLTYKGIPRTFPAQLRTAGYIHRIEVNVEGQNILFEPDEERNYRALVRYEQLQEYKAIDAGLLEAIAEGIEAIVK